MQGYLVVKWMLKANDVSAILTRLQSSKVSLNLVLTNLTWLAITQIRVIDRTMADQESRY